MGRRASKYVSVLSFSVALILIFALSSGFCVVAGPLENWHPRTSGTSGTLYAIAWGNNTFVAVGDSGTILTSPDGVTWTPQTSGTTNSLRAATYANNTFVVAGSGGTILTSADGANWTPQTSGTLNTLMGIIYGNETFVIVGMGAVPNPSTILTSSNGTAWTAQASGTSLPLYSVAYGNNTFVAVGMNPGFGTGIILSSANSTNWQTVSSTVNTLYTVAYGNNIFAAGGMGGPPPMATTYNLYTSSNGTNWQSATVGPSYYYFFSLAYGYSTFVGVGTGNTILTSPDGTTWTSRASGTSNILRGICYGRNTFVAVGDTGTIVQSDSTVTYTISGTVKDLATGLAIPDALVTTKDSVTGTLAGTATTNTSGVYTVTLSFPGTYTVTPSKQGYESMSSPDPLQVSDAVPTITADLFMTVQDLFPLSEGWNFISFPRVPTPSDITTLMAGVTNIRIIWGYDSATQTWKKWTPGGGQANTLTTAETGKGYWVYVDAPASLDITGWPAPQSTTILLSEQWNLVGYLGADAISVVTELNGIAGKWLIVWNWTDNQWYGRHFSITTLPAPILSLTAFNTGKAYWIKIRPGMGGNWVQ